MADIDGIKAEMRRLFIAGTKATMNHRNASGSRGTEIRDLFPYPDSEKMADSWTSK
jgi:hypothetical protein